jgi:hypothetical protein
MVKVNGKTIKAKVKATRNPLFADEKYTGGEPIWDAERARTMDDADFDHHMRKSLRYYNYFYSVKELRKYVNEWVKTSGKIDPETAVAYLKSPDRYTPITLCSLIKANEQGMPLKDNALEKIREWIAEAAKHAIDETDEPAANVEKKPEPYRPTIQDRLNEKLSETLGEMEGWADEAFSNTKTDHKAYDFLTLQKVPQAQIGRVRVVFQEKRDELELAKSGQDEQLKEGYSHLKAADFKRILSWIDRVLADIDSFEKVKKTQRKARVKKAPSKEKVVAKLKYLKEDKDLKLVSISPSDIIGAQELWVYNVKTRKLGKYMAAQYQELGVKGTSITGYDETRSVSKTLRKPEEKIREFGKASKIQLRKFLEEIRATETRLNGRINADILLLKVQ